MSNHSLTARETNPPFSHKSVVSFTHEQNIICSKTLICRQLFAGHVVGSRPMKRKENHRMIIGFIVRLGLYFYLWSRVGVTLWTSSVHVFQDRLDVNEERGLLHLFIISRQLL